MLFKNKKNMMAAVLALAMCAGAAFAQKTPAPGTHWTVSKNADDMANFSTIQAAVNAAQPGQVIEILDEAVYPEQVTIDGRLPATGAAGETQATHHRWGAGIGGNKNGITIRYIPLTGVAARPTIRHRDVENISPKTYAESRTPGDIVGTSGNFETNGALRIIRADGIKIEGIKVDGISAFPIAHAAIWDNQHALAHGNAGIAVAVSGNVQIRDCEIFNAYNGISVKDRNTGGVFGNPNPADNDNTVPMSGFGNNGNHLFEYNKLHSNVVGIYFESSWDRGSTVRHNLIYHNYWRATRPSIGSADSDWCGAGMKFKDNYLSPVAIYNNTFFENTRNFGRGWQVGAQHLIFNNIFGRKKISTASTNQFDDENGSQSLDGDFPNRMFHNLFSATHDIQVQRQGQQQLGQCNLDFDTVWVTAVTFREGLPNAQSTNYTHTVPYTCEYNPGQIQNQTHSQNMNGPRPGALLVGNSTDTTTGLAGGKNRWLETAGFVHSGNLPNTPRRNFILPNLFKSINPADADFLVPRYDDAATPDVNNFIKGKGWAGSGILNDAGTGPADIGAIPSSGKRPGDCRPQVSRARISPFGVITLNAAGTQATASITITEEMAASLGGPITIEYIRWVAPLPELNPLKGTPAASIVIPASAIRSPTGTLPTLNVGTNIVTFTVPGGAIPVYGFFELVVNGNAAGKKVSSDVGFLPFRQLDQYFKIEVLRNGVVIPPGPGGTPPVVTAGEPGLSLRVTAMKRATPQDTAFNEKPNSALTVTYKLQSDPAARMYQSITPVPNNPLVGDPDLRTGESYIKTYNPIFFTKAHPTEVIDAAGVWCGGVCTKDNGLPFHGTLVINVRPGVPEKVTFVEPVPKRMLPDGVLPPVISGTYNGQVRVEDKFGNPTDQAVPVTMRAQNVTNKPDPIGSVAPPTATTLTDGTGIATFIASVENGVVGDIFELTASISNNTVSDTARLRVARAADALRALFVNNVTTNGRGDWRTDLDDPRNDRIDTLAGTWVPVWVKAVSTSSSVDTVLTSRTNSGGSPLYVCVTPSDPKLLLSLPNAAGTGPANPAGVAGPITVPIVNGVAQVYVTSNDDVSGVRLDVRAVRGNSCDATRDNSLNEGRSNLITFFKPKTDILSARVFANNGDARPDRIEIYYSKPPQGEIVTPKAVTLKWPGECMPAVAAGALTSRADRGDTTIFTFPLTPASFEPYYTTTVDNRRILSITDGETNEVEINTEVLDGIGPLIAGDPGNAPSYVLTGRCGDVNRSAPLLIENNRFADGIPDTLEIYVTEALNSNTALVGRSIVLSGPAPGANPDTISVAEVLQLGSLIRLVLTRSGEDHRPKPTDCWVSFNSSHTGLADRSGNPAHAANRPVPIRLKETAPDLKEAWYTADDLTGRPNYAYITFNKSIYGRLDEFFVGGSLEFRWTNSINETFKVENPSALFASPNLTGGNDTLRIDLKIAFKNAASGPPMMPGSSNMPRPITGGPMGITINYNKDGMTSAWEKGDIVAADKARPVLVSAKLVMGSIDDNNNSLPDTLTLIYSEPLEGSIESIKSPVLFGDPSLPFGGPLNYFVLTLVSRSPSDAGSHQVVYTVDSYFGGEPVKGDSVWIHNAAGVTDMYSNVQDVYRNRAVLLEIEPAKPRMVVTIRSNPFRGGNGNTASIVFDPKVKAGVVVEMRVTGTLYSSMGNLVVEQRLDTVITDSRDKLVWPWDGRNKHGRYVGTGTYLFKAKVETRTAANANDLKNEKWERGNDEVRKIGFVRGKGQ